MRDLYWTSYVLAAKPCSDQDWVYYGHTLTLALCIWTHCYKALRLFGLCLKIIGVGIPPSTAVAQTNNTTSMVISMVMVGAGGAFSVVGSRVAPQAAGPHQDVAIAISRACWH
ncbi:Siderophore iron transporter 3 [Metarhizium brunneum]|uniref:Siderophore iron transporter 3 n=1 Tax=Metarhizium brunneum TaxID=500148 RepID=A0A7D5UV32_9HYPO|nr:Siderophore iron transporter 3 [Metarhizium brunneum]